MGNSSGAVVGVVTTQPFPVNIPPREDLEPGPILVQMGEWGRTHIAAIPEYLFPEIRETRNVGLDHVPRRGRGVQQNLVVGEPPFMFQGAAVPHMPSQCQRLLVLVISSAVLIWLSSVITPVNLPTSILPADLPVYLTRVVDIVNKRAGHVSGNVAAASVCLVQVGLRIVGIAPEAMCHGEQYDVIS
ncbi:unnamed protein product [Rhizoctonia solani]|uniref:Uncharacterized protein n=1 Tax=Rhizoctonia solani TaxID=456999 RepID=A0A8H3I150_9AGAM|nr:unnamed protein product [Rhizoctonia solani]